VPPGEQDVLGLDVPVDDAVPVGAIERVGHLTREANGLLNRELNFSAEAVAEGLALNKRHRVPE
jgi:hypothetical protein